MAQTIKLKRSSTSGNTPTTSQLALGEMAINTTDGKVFIKKSVSGTESVVEVSNSQSIVSTAPSSASGFPNGHVWYVV